ncbi:MAG: ABC transporter permease [Verrucomicrobiota bacterium]
MMQRKYRRRGRYRKKIFDKRVVSQRFDLLRELVGRDLKVMYKRSVLGIAWTLINPVLQLIVFVLVFKFVLSIDTPNYPSFVFTGLLVWNWFHTSLFQSAMAIVANRALIRQPNFPPAILPVSTVTTGWIHLIFAMPVLLGFLLLESTQIHPLFLFIIPLLMALQFILSTSLGYLLASLNVMFRDTQHTIGVILQLLFYLTGVFYEIKNVPEKYELLYNMNPMVHIIGAYRSILITGTLPSPTPLIIIAILSLILLPLGYTFFCNQSTRFVEEL